MLHKGSEVLTLFLENRPSSNLPQRDFAMTFRLTLRLSGRFPNVPLSSEQYSEIAKAKHGLMQALYVEEKLDLVLQNYVDVELELLRRS